MDFSSLGLKERLIDAINKAKYENPYPIQLQAIPAILQKKDILGIAPTGSGKTASYVLPILQLLVEKDGPMDRSVPVLVIVPTRELAAQVQEVVKMFSEFLPRRIKTMAVFGGVSINPQMMNLHGTEILVATPGRLLDLLSRNAIQLDKLQVLVLDEADKVLNLGFKLEVDEILSRLPKTRQNILFSATMEEGVETLIQKLLRIRSKLKSNRTK